MAVSSSTMRLNTNDKKEAVKKPIGSKKKKKKKKNKADISALHPKLSYEQIDDKSFYYYPQDWTEASEELSFDDVQKAVSDAVRDLYEIPANSPGINQYPYSSSRYYIYKIWPDKVVLKRSYDNKDDSDPLFIMHAYSIVGEDAVLDGGQEVELGFVPFGQGADEFLKAVREVDAASLDDPAFKLEEIESEEVEEEDSEDEPDDEEEPEEDDDVDGDDDEDDNDDEDELGAEEDESNEEDNVQEGNLREDVANLKEQDFNEAFDCIVDDQARIVEGKNGSYMIENMAMLGPKSKNNRGYSKEVRIKAAKIFEGIKAYMNHPDKDKADDPRRVQELIGRHFNVHFDENTDMLRSTLKLSPTHLVKEYLIPHAKANPGILGNSINASGKIDSKGNVLEITKGRSVDIVAEPATTNGLFESVQKQKLANNEGGEEIMEKDITLQDVLENAELCDEARKHFREELEVELSVDEIQEENQSLKEKVKEFELKEQARTDELTVDKLIAESKLSESAKKDKEIRDLLLEAKPERRTALLARFEKVQESAGDEGDEPKKSAAREKEIQEGTGGKKTTTKTQLRESFRNGLVAIGRRR